MNPSQFGYYVIKEYINNKFDYEIIEDYYFSAKYFLIDEENDVELNISNNSYSKISNLKIT